MDADRPVSLEWDEGKRRATREARGLDFADLARYDWGSALDRADPRAYQSPIGAPEERRVSVGFLDRRLIVVAYTVRGECIRVISMRKANARERRAHERRTRDDRT